MSSFLWKWNGSHASMFTTNSQRIEIRVKSHVKIIGLQGNKSLLMPNIIRLAFFCNHSTIPNLDHCYWSNKLLQSTFEIQFILVKNFVKILSLSLLETLTLINSLNQRCLFCLLVKYYITEGRIRGLIDDSMFKILKRKIFLSKNFLLLVEIRIIFPVFEEMDMLHLRTSEYEVKITTVCKEVHMYVWLFCLFSKRKEISCNKFCRKMKHEW